jgi:hypothetical protein
VLYALTKGFPFAELKVMSRANVAVPVPDTFVRLAALISPELGAVATTAPDPE